MGTYVKIQVENIVIPAGNVTAAHAALRGLWTDKPTGWLRRRREAGFDGPKGRPAFAWVFLPKDGAPTLVEELLGWHYDAQELPDGSVKLLRFRADKWGDDEALYRALAPFVRGPGRILAHYRFERHEQRYTFENGDLRLESRCNKPGKPWTAWAPLPFYGDGPEREWGIKSRKSWRRMERELAKQEAEDRKRPKPEPETSLRSDVLILPGQERESVPADPFARRILGVRRRSVQ